MDNKTLLEFLGQYDKSFGQEENVHYASKAFVVRSILKWCTDRREQGVIDEKQFDQCIVVIGKFVEDKVKLYWKDNNVMVESAHLKKRLNEINAENKQ